MGPARPLFKGDTLRDFAAGLWGAGLGMYLTALVLAICMPSLQARGTTFHPEISPFQGLEAAATLPWQEVLEKRMYFLQCAFCPALAWLAVRWAPRLGGWTCLAACILFVPAVTAVYRHCYRGEPRSADLVLAGLALTLPMLAAAGRRLVRRSGAIATPGTAPNPPVVQAEPDCPENTWPALRRRALRSLPLALVLLGLLVLFYGPRDVGALADRFTGDFHIASFLVGPALYYHSPTMVPGLDFESHYGIGHAYAFAFLLGPSLHATLCHYVWFLFAVTAFFYLSAYFVLTGLLRSPRAAFLAAVLLAAIGMECNSFASPSNWPVRSPFLFLFVGCASRAELFGRRWLHAVVTGLFAGLSLFWQTDIGLCLSVGGLGYYGVLALRERGGLARPALFLLAAGGGFAALCGLAFGPRTLMPLFYQRLLEPLLLYSTGFGFTLMRWRAGWSYLYNLIGPAVALATLGWAAHQLGAPDARSRAQARFLFPCAAVGLLMLFKWVNRSMDLLWSLNAVLVLVLLFWWARYAALACGEMLEARAGARPSFAAGRRLRTLIGGAAFAALLGVAGLASAFHTPEDQAGLSSSPLLRIAHFTTHNPTLANALLCNPNRDGPIPAMAGIDAADVAFLRANTAPAQPVIVLSPREWVYLAEAQRPPGLPWVPVCLTHCRGLVERVERTVREAEFLFVERDGMSAFRWWNAPLHDRLLPILERDFTLVGTGKGLDLYRRKTPGSP